MTSNRLIVRADFLVLAEQQRQNARTNPCQFGPIRTEPGKSPFA
jgi:hypothetical protein